MAPLPSADEVRARVAAPDVTAPTRRALLARLEPPSGPPRALDDRQLDVLRAVAGRLVPLEGLHLAERLDAQLADGPGDGWRHADMPADLEAHRQALDRLADAGFAQLDAPGRDAVLEAVRRGEPPGGAWPFPAERWFEEVLAALVRLAYSHPAVQMAVGYDGFADAWGRPPSA